MAKLTKAQARIVAEMQKGQRLIKAFDVWRGYFWFLEPSLAIVRGETAEILLRHKVIAPQENKRIYSGYQEQIHILVGAAK